MTTRDEFLARYGGVYEATPWIAGAAWDAGRTDPAGLAEVFRAVVDTAPRARQLALLRSHPDLAGRLAVAGEMTAESTGEQAGAGLDRCSAAEFEEFQALNDSYRQRFGFPFILAVRGHDRASILRIFRQRAGNDPATEFGEALEQVHRIAALRLGDIHGSSR